MRVLGIDPGSRNTGMGIVEIEGSRLRVIGFDRVRMGSEPLPKRLSMIYAGIEEAIFTHKPDIVAIEQVFVAKNAKSALILGQARGAAICAAVNSFCEVYEYSALQIKRAVVGSGAAKKEQVQHMVKILLNLRELPSSDEADALACAICHLHTAQSQQRIAGVGL